MRKPIRSKSTQIGFPPGTLAHVGEHNAKQTGITVIEYDEAQVREGQHSVLAWASEIGRSWAPPMSVRRISSETGVQWVVNLTSAFGMAPAYVSGEEMGVVLGLLNSAQVIFRFRRDHRQSVPRGTDPGLLALPARRM